MSDKVLLLTIGAPPLPNITPIVPVTTTPTVDGHTAADLAPPTSLQTLVTVDAVQLTWQPSAAGDGVEYFVEAVADVSGSPSGSYAEVAVTGNTTITLPLLTGKWFRVRARLNGRVSAPTAAARCIPGITVTQISGVIARMPAGVGTLATQASVADEAIARAEGDAASAAAITVVDAKVDGKASSVAVSELASRVTVNEAGLATFEASYTLKLDVAGKVSGFKSVNDGATSSFDFNADYVNFITSSDTGFNLSKTGFDRRYGAIAIYEGDAFGTDSLVYWIGPKSIGKASAKKSNATLWFDATGNAYFGGTLSAGVFKNGARSSQFGGSVQVETGEFGTNGNPKVVTASCVYSNTGYVSSSLGNASLTGSFVVERSIGGGAWSTVASGSITGNRTEIEYEPGLGYLTEWFCSASVTFTDTDASTSNFNYRIRLTGASGWPYNLGGVVGLGTQTTSILSTEE